MKLLVFQGSPRPQGFTQLVLDSFLQGAANKGASAEVVRLADKNIRQCTGCYSCWYDTPGVCAQQGDDMAGILEQMRSCDVEVYATPLYACGMTAPTKRVIERALPLLLPFLVDDREGLTAHPVRPPVREGRAMALISVCGFPEVEHFSSLVGQFRALARVSGRTLAGVLLRPGSESMLFLEQLGKTGQEVLDGFRRAGEELAERGRVSPETEETVRRPWTRNLQASREQANAFWSVRIEHARAARRGTETRSFEEAAKEDMRILLTSLATRFDGGSAAALQATIQFDVRGSQPGRWNLEIRDGECLFQEGMAASPTLTIHTSAEIWRAIASGRLDGGKAFWDGQYTVDGDLGLLRRFPALFGGRNGPIAGR